MTRSVITLITSVVLACGGVLAFGDESSTVSNSGTTPRGMHDFEATSTHFDMAGGERVEIDILADFTPANPCVIVSTEVIVSIVCDGNQADLPFKEEGAASGMREFNVSIGEIEGAFADAGHPIPADIRDCTIQYVYKVHLKCPNKSVKIEVKQNENDPGRDD